MELVCHFFFDPSPISSHQLFSFGHSFTNTYSNYSSLIC